MQNHIEKLCKMADYFRILDHDMVKVKPIKMI